MLEFKNYKSPIINKNKIHCLTLDEKKITTVEKKLQYHDHSTILSAVDLNFASIFSQSSTLRELHVCRSCELRMIFECTSHNMDGGRG